jgi:hypothetical protein
VSGSLDYVRSILCRQGTTTPDQPERCACCDGTTFVIDTYAPDEKRCLDCNWSWVVRGFGYSAPTDLALPDEEQCVSPVETGYLQGHRCRRRVSNDALRMCYVHEKDWDREQSRLRYEDDRKLAQDEPKSWIGKDIKAERDAGESVVYFVAKGDLVKIGTSTNVKKRVAAISKGSSLLDGMTVGPVQLLVTMPGGYRLEARLHEQFHGFWVGGEWFQMNPKLARLIARLQRRSEQEAAA